MLITEWKKKIIIDDGIPFILLTIFNISLFVHFLLSLFVFFSVYMLKFCTLSLEFIIKNYFRDSKSLEKISFSSSYFFNPVDSLFIFFFSLISFDSFRGENYLHKFKRHLAFHAVRQLLENHNFCFLVLFVSLWSTWSMRIHYWMWWRIFVVL